MAGPVATLAEPEPAVLLLCRLFDDLWLFGVSLEVELPRSRLPGELAECCEVESVLCLLFPPLYDPPLLPLGPPPPPLPFSASHSLCPSGGLPLAARAPWSNSRLSEKSKLNEFRLVRRIFAHYQHWLIDHNIARFLASVDADLTLSWHSKLIYSFFCSNHTRTLMSRPNKTC